jgi:hypothetical protein
MASIPGAKGWNSLPGAGLDGTIVRFPKNSRVGGSGSPSVLNAFSVRKFPGPELPGGVDSSSSFLLSSLMEAFTAAGPSLVCAPFD